MIVEKYRKERVRLACNGLSWFIPVFISEGRTKNNYGNSIETRIDVIIKIQRAPCPSLYDVSLLVFEFFAYN